MSNISEINLRRELGLDFMDQIHKKFSSPKEHKGWNIIRGQDSLLRAEITVNKTMPRLMRVVFTPPEQTDYYFATIINKYYKGEDINRETKSVTFLEISQGNEPVYEHFKYDNDIARRWKRRRIYRGRDALLELSDDLVFLWST